MAVTLNQFMQDVVTSGLLTAEEVHEFFESLPETGRHDARGFARQLVRQGKLTSFQAARILSGTPHGLLLGNNVIVAKIGEGGMGEVFKAEHRRMKRPVVIKVLPKSATKSEYLVKRFQREVEAAARLSHPNIVTAYDADEEEGIHFLVMEYVDGEPLGRFVAERGTLPVQQAIDCILQAARGLEYAHKQGVIHRDIKPNNLLIDRSGVIKILDMGLARIDDPFTSEERPEDQLTRANQIVGTVEYMSPEQADRSARVDGRSDIYSLGCTLFYLLTGEAPFSSESPIRSLMAHRLDEIPSLREKRSDVPVDVAKVFQRMMAKDPDDRFQSMGELVTALEACRDESTFELCIPVTKNDSPKSEPADTGLIDLDEHVNAEAGPADSTTPTRDVHACHETQSSLKLASRHAARKQKAVSDPAVGIDLGTTYSAIAYLDEQQRPVTLANAEGDKLTPSVVLFDREDVIVGKEAVKAMSTDMDMIAECAKRDLGLRHYHKAIRDEQFPPEALQAWILNKLRNDVVPQIGEFSKVVITVPAYFDEVRRKATQDAGYIAGLEVLDIINEPTAAAVAYGFKKGILRPDSMSGKPEIILVYDLGGGTFDVTVMEINGNDFVALATDGDVQLGGHDWDLRLMDYVAKQFIENFNMDPREDANVYGRLWRECEDAKRTLSARHRASVPCDAHGHSLRVEITRDKFQELTQDLLDRTAFTTRCVIRAAGLENDDIDRVLLVGGSSRMPAVGKMLNELTGKELDRSVSPDEAVAHGAALHAGLLLARHEGQPPRFTVKNLNSHSLGVVATDLLTKRKQTAVLIPRNTPLPASAGRTFITKKAGQSSIMVKIVEGESESPDACSHIGKCTIRELPPDLPAKTPIEVNFDYAENGRLTVSVRVAGTDKQLKHEITRDNSMTPEQLNSWRQKVAGLEADDVAMPPQS